MDYYERKIKDVIKEGLYENTTRMICLKAGNPYRILELELSEIENQAIQETTNSIYKGLKYKGMIK